MQIRVSILTADGDWLVTDVIDDVGGDWWMERWEDKVIIHTPRREGSKCHLFYIGPTTHFKVAALN